MVGRTREHDSLVVNSTNARFNVTAERWDLRLSSSSHSRIDNSQEDSRVLAITRTAITWGSIGSIVALFLCVRALFK